MHDDLLPHETSIQTAIARLLKQELNCASNLLTFGISLMGKKDLHQVHLPHDSVVTAVGLFVKASISFRAIIHLCAAGLDRSAMPVSRSLFETSLNLTFLIRRRVVLYQFNDSKRKPRTKWELFGKRLSPRFRTALYNAWCVLKDEKMANDQSRTPGLKRAGRRFRKKLDEVVRPYVDDIGSDWESRIKGKNTCVGLSISDFAASLGNNFQRWHRIVYALDSQSVHQTDMLNYLTANEETAAFSPRWHSSPQEVKEALHKASVTYHCCVDELNRRFDFGKNETDAIKQFSDSLLRWID